MTIIKSKYNKLNDEQLMRLIHKKNIPAFNELYDRYANKLLNYFYRMLNGNKQKAQDFLQDLFTKIIEKPTVYDFSFDTDWILAAIAMEESFAKVPFAFIDSAAESASITQGPMTTWETLLLGLRKAVSARGVPTNDDMVRVLDEEIHDYRDLELLINHLPPELENATDAQLGDPAVMSPSALQKWIQERKEIGD